MPLGLHCCFPDPQAPTALTCFSAGGAALRAAEQPAALKRAILSRYDSVELGSETRARPHTTAPRIAYYSSLRLRSGIVYCLRRAGRTASASRVGASVYRTRN